MSTKNIEAVYSLSPIQEALLSQGPSAANLKLNTGQMSFILQGRLDIAAFERAWRLTVERHPMLRTSFVWKRVERPLQIVHKKTDISLALHDWLGLAQTDQQNELEILREAEFNRAFSPSELPQFRLTLCCTAEDAHLFLWTYARLILDGYSLPLILKEVFALYAAFCEGRQVQLKPARSYDDYVDWLRRQDSSEAEQFWRQELKGFSVPTPVGVDRAVDDPLGAAEEYGREQIRLSCATSAALRALAHDYQLTLSTLLQGAWALVLNRYSGQRDIVIGAMVSGRPTSLPEAESIVGPLVNTLPIRVEIPSQTSALEWLKKVEAHMLCLRGFQHTSAALVRSLIEMPEDLPLFYSCVVVDDYPSYDPLPFGGEALQVLDIKSFDGANAPLTLKALQKDGLFLEAKYDRRRFADDQVVRLLRHVEATLEGIIANPIQAVSQLPRMTDRESRQLLVEWNNTRTEYPRERCIHHLFEDKATEMPDDIAVLFEEDQLTYGELNRRANQLAHWLRLTGVGPEVLVGICVERSLEMIVGILGILKAGGAYVPLDPSYPLERLALMLEDAQTSILLTQEKLLDVLPAHWGQVICLDTDWESIAAGNDADPISETAPENLAYVMYTSGSTGKPRGVSVTHRNVVRLVKETSYVSFTSEEIFLQLAPISFDAATFEIWGSLLNGAKLAIFPARIPSLEDIGEAISRYGVTTLWLTAGLFHLMVDERLDDFRPLRQLLAGGDVLSVKHTEEVKKRLNGLNLINGYGPTESTTFTCCYTVSEAGQVRSSVPIGKPIANTTVYVLTADLEPVPVGVTGELYIGGDGLARGYMNRTKLTAEKFIPNPFSDEPGARLYKTGDLARYLTDGNIEFLGRKDHQVKIRGFRIELGEVEAVLNQHPLVQDVVVTSREYAHGDKRLIAYVVINKEASVNQDDLRGFLKRKLPEYMLPSSFMMLDKLPLSSNGKVNRSALPEPEYDAPESEEIFIRPMNYVEESLSEVWADVLGIKRVSLKDNFFDMGGHSLLATQVISRVRNIFQLDVALRSLFESLTLESFARSVEEAIKAGQTMNAPPLVPAPRGAELPLSFSQQRLWFLDQMNPGNSAFYIPCVVRLSGDLRVDALEKSFNEIIRRHEALRTNFVSVNGQPAQVIASEMPLSLPVIDLQNITGSDQAEVERLIIAEAHHPFNLAQGPLLRATLLQLDTQERLLLITMHHIISDGWSLGVFVQELAALYKSFLNNRPSPLDDLPIQYADYARWQRDWLRGEVLEAQLEYWVKQISGSPPVLELPTDRPRPPVQTYHGAKQSLVLSLELTEALKSLSCREGVTLFTTMLAAFKLLLHRYSGQDDIVVGSPIAGRNRGEVERLIGFFLNTLVLRTDMSGNPTFRELLQREREVTLGAYAHQDVPFEMLLEALQPERDLSRTPLFQVFFNMLNFPKIEMDLPGLTIELLWTPEIESKFDLTLYVEERADGIHLDLVYRTDLFDQPRMVEMLEQFMLLLSQVTQAPEHQIGSFSLVTPAAVTLLPDPTQPIHPDWQGPVHTLFHQQACRNAGRVAVKDKRESWTYGELDSRTNQLASYLLSKGIKREDVVAVYAHRGASLVWALLGVLKAGAAFLILDHAYPASRLIEYLRIAKPRAWLHTEGAGEIPASLDEYLSVLPLACRFMLPDQKTDEALALLTDYSTGEQEIELTPDSLAYVTFTSGSTGKPKAVMGRHGPLAFFATWTKEVFGLDDSERISMLSGLSHDPLHRDIFMPLQLGATLCIPDQQDVIMTGGLSQWMSQEKITVINLTPAMCKLLPETTPDNYEYRIETLRYAFFVGDVLSKGDVSRLWKIAPSLTCVNLYGSTETQRALGYYIVPRAGNVADKCAAESSLEREILPLGCGIKDVQLLVLNDGDQLAGVGELGEIHFRSPHLARGYMDDEALTQERFVINPFTKAAGDRLYKSGDLGRYRPDGNVEFVGRKDQQVKIRGFRIEPGEIEAVLSRHPAVWEAAVVAREDNPGDRRLVAYVVADTHSALRANDLRGFLKEKLPEYMVPSTFVMIDALPLTPNAKIDRRALPPPERIRSEPEVGFVAARTPTEEVLAAIWADVLGVAEIGIHNNFFELGGHSLLAAQVLSRLRDSFKVNVPLRALFESPTVASLAQSVEAEIRAGIHLEAPPIVPVSRDGELPLSYAQQRLWFLNKLEPRNPAYNMPAAVRLTGPLNVDALGRAFNEITRRHESLRTSFPVVNGYPVQSIASILHVDLRLEDLSALPEDEREAEVERQANDEARRPFDLAKGPLFRVRLLRIAEDEHVVLLTMHHIISDGWSMGVFVREAAALYRAFCDERPSPLEELRIQYADFARWQREWIKGDVLESHLSYWKDELAEAPDSLALPTDRQRLATQSYRSARNVLVLPPSLINSINSVSRRQSVSPFMMMLTALKILLFRWTGQSDILVGTVSANRNYPEIENLIGCFIDFLPLRSKLSSDQTVLDLLRQVKATVLNSFSHQDCSFAKIIEAVKPNREAGRTPIYNVAFLMQNFAREDHFSETLQANLLPTDRGLGALLDLRFIVVPEALPAGWQFACEYKAELFDAETIEHLMYSYHAILERMLCHLDVQISTFDLSDELEARARIARLRDEKSTIAITATFTAEPLEESLAFWMEELGIQSEIKFAPYNQVFQQLLDPSSLLSENQKGINVILLRLEDWQRYEVDASEDSGSYEQVENNVRDIVLAFKSAAERSAIPHLLCLCPASTIATADQKRAAFLKKMEEVITFSLKEATGVYLLTASEIFSTYPVEEYYDPYGDEQSHIPYTPAFYAAIGTMIARKINALNNSPYKVIVLDCDQTLWEGVCGEDGPFGIRIDPPRKVLQEFMIAQHDAGMLICLCSKNNEEDVLQVFERRSDMCLKREHIISCRHNWKPKSENIRSLADELKLGLDSFIFIDDNPLECAEVEANCPEVLTLQLPQDVNSIQVFLKHIWAFDHLKSTKEDRRRTEFYRQDKNRELARSKSLTFEEFLTSLGLEVRISEMVPGNLARVSELTRRTNQFNLTTIRRSESEIERLCLSARFECLCVEVRDRFGDYGLVGVMIFEVGSDAMEVDTFLLSCRVLGRGVEHRMLSRLGEIAKERGLSWINLKYIPTDKNRLALDVFENIGTQFKVSLGESSVFRFPAVLAAALSHDRFSQEN